MGDGSDDDSSILGGEDSTGALFLEKLTDLQQEVLKIAHDSIKHHYTLNSRKLYYQCVRAMQDVDKVAIMNAIDTLIKRRVFFPGKALTKDRLLENTLRDEIYHLVREEPGIHFSRIKAKLGLDSNTLIWHVKMLEKYGLVRVEKFGNNTVYFDARLPNDHDLLYFYLHKRDVPEIFKEVVAKPGLSFQELLAATRLARSTLVRKLKELITNDLLVVEHTTNRITSIEVNPSCKDPCVKYLYSLFWD